jgi:hypothetical protein
VIEEIIVVPGDPNTQVCCITDREDPWHCWLRAAVHCSKFKEFSFAVQIMSSRDCLLAAQAILKEPQLPRKMPPQFSWRGIDGKL